MSTVKQCPKCYHVLQWVLEMCFLKTGEVGFLLQCHSDPGLYNFFSWVFGFVLGGLVGSVSPLPPSRPNLLISLLVMGYIELRLITAKLLILHLLSNWRSKNDWLHVHQASSWKSLQTNNELQRDLSSSSLLEKLMLRLSTQILKF